MKRRMGARAIMGIGAALLGWGGEALLSSGCSGDDAGAADASAVFDAGPITIEEAGPPIPSDAGTCTPNGAAVSTSSPAFAALAQKSCTTAQIASYTSLCFDTVSYDHTACAAFTADAGNAACAGCLVGSPGQAMQAPIVSTTFLDGVLPTSNVGGCIATLDPTQASCGAATAASDECALDQCVGCSSETDEVDALNECLTVAAYDGPCSTLQKAEDTCQTALPPGSAGVSCLYFYGAPSPAMQDDVFIEYATAVCGGGVSTGTGTDGGDGG